jgi:hypothetical protein
MPREVFAALLAAVTHITGIMAQTGQTVPKDTCYNAAVQGFVHEVTLSHPTNNGWVLIDEVETRPPADFVKSCLADTADFTPGERQQIAVWVGKPPLSRWTAALAGDIRIIPAGWANIYYPDQLLSFKITNSCPLIGPGTLRYGCPLFLRHETWCLFYAVTNRIGGCSLGTLALYKKSGDHWIRVKNLGSWAT